MPATENPILPWHESSWLRVVEWSRLDRLPHALLLSAVRGSGKRDFAERLATWLLCSNPGDVACGECKHCRLRAAGAHPDIQVCTPADSRVIKVDQVRALTEFLVQSPQVAARKIAIVDTADQLNMNAANALLKTLEEPATDVNLLLLQHAGQRILPTLRSRCQVLSLPTPPIDTARDWLLSRLEGEEGRDPELLDHALALAGGAPLAAQALIHDGHLAAAEQCLSALRQYLKGQVVLSDAVAPFLKEGLASTLVFMGRWAQDLARLGAGGHGEDHQAHDMLSYLAQHNHPAEVHHLYARIQEARAGMTYNLNPELEIGQLLMAWRKLMPRKQARAS
ncbi:DNA polymerase III subunit delta' [Mangrovitalea sediminis]|uniref:DNA polymerase III subunit delta' n=1 Tax=Mangrovitalea sediminis TaxID=1982043 RepID=UPI000BE59E8C|nr:DNA polymerase III subunit delta' [Mangrovitalea sediminis]